MFLTEYDEEQHLKNVMRIGFNEGIQQGVKQGKTEGLLKGVNALVKEGLEYGQERADIINKLMKYFDLSESEAEEYFEKYSK